MDTFLEIWKLSKITEDEIYILNSKNLPNDTL